MFGIDTHVHSSRYSPCAPFLKLERLKDEKFPSTLNGVVITDHDSWWPKEEWTTLVEATKNLKLYRGIELSSEEGCHLVIIGLSSPGPLKKGIRCQTAISFAHSHEAAVILAHPYSKPLPPEYILEKLDAVEVFSSSFEGTDTKRAIELAKTINKPTLACSDAHSIGRIGLGYTAFPRPPRDDFELAQFVKRGMGKAICC